MHLWAFGLTPARWRFPDSTRTSPPPPPPIAANSRQFFRFRALSAIRQRSVIVPSSPLSDRSAPPQRSVSNLLSGPVSTSSAVYQRLSTIGQRSVSADPRGSGSNGWGPRRVSLGAPPRVEHDGAARVPLYATRIPGPRCNSVEGHWRSRRPGAEGRRSAGGSRRTAGTPRHRRRTGTWKEDLSVQIATLTISTQGVKAGTPASATSSVHNFMYILIPWWPGARICVVTWALIR